MADPENAVRQLSRTEDPPETLDHLRNRVVNIVLKVLGFIVPVPLAGSLYRYTDIGWQPAMAVHIAAVISIYLVIFYRRRMSVAFKTWFLVILFMIIGAAGLVNFGVLSAALFLFIFAAVITTSLLGIRLGLILFGIAALNIAVFAVAFRSGHMSYSFDPAGYVHSTPAWINLLTGFILSNALILGVVAVMNTSFIRSIEILRRRREELETEIREREKAQEAHAQSERNYREIFNAAADAILIHEEHTGHILDMNRTMLEMFGYTRQEAAELRLQDLSSGIPPHSEEEALTWIRKAVETGPQTFEWQSRKKKGELFWTEVTLRSTMIGGEGRILAGVRDISNRKEQEKAIERERKFLDTVASAMPGILYMYDDQSRLKWWNRRFETITGYGAEEIENKPLLSWFDENDGKRAEEKLFTEGVSSLEAGLIMKDGHKVPFFLRGVPAEIDGKSYFMGAGLDITRRKRAEDGLKSSLHEKEMLLKEIHHRVKNNLQAVAGLLGLQASITDDVWTTKVLRDSQNRVYAMALIHERLYQAEDLANIDLSDYIYHLARHLKASFGAVAENIFVRTECENVILNLDTAIPCGLIITELVTNALRYAFPQQMAGEIWVRMKSNGDGGYVLSVSDDGAELPPGMETQAAGKMGLMLVRSFVEFLGGTMEVERNGGTVFKVFFREYAECPVDQL